MTAPRPLLVGGTVPPEVHAFLARKWPHLSAERREEWLMEVLEGSRFPCYTREAEDRRLESALVDLWRHPTPETARACISLAAVTLGQRGRRQRPWGNAPSRLIDVEPFRMGPYLLDRLLGYGGDGTVLHGRHEHTRQEVAVKIPARGEALAYGLLQEWHPSILRTLEVWQVGDRLVAVREYANGGTLAGLLRERKGRPLSTAEALGVFGTCCEAAAWAMDRGLYRWSAHPRNILKTAGAWKIADFGRSVAFVEPPHPLLADHLSGILAAIGADDGEDALATAEWIRDSVLWGHPTGYAVFPRDVERERRLQLDQCSMLAGLLVEMLAPGSRADFYRRAIAKEPFCSARYPLTGDRPTDETLSRIINRAWRGDEGGALLLANRGRGEQSVYTDPLELLADVRAALRR